MIVMGPTANAVAVGAAPSPGLVPLVAGPAGPRFRAHVPRSPSSPPRDPGGLLGDDVAGVATAGAAVVSSTASWTVVAYTAGSPGFSVLVELARAGVGVGAAGVSYAAADAAAALTYGGGLA